MTLTVTDDRCEFAISNLHLTGGIPPARTPPRARIRLRLQLASRRFAGQAVTILLVRVDYQHHVRRCQRHPAIRLVRLGVIGMELGQGHMSLEYMCIDNRGYVMRSHSSDTTGSRVATLPGVKCQESTIVMLSRSQDRQVKNFKNSIFWGSQSPKQHLSGVGGVGGVGISGSGSG